MSILNAKKKPVLSVIVACYGDAYALPHLYRRIVDVCRRLRVTFELIIVNDGSPDHAESVIRQLVAGDRRVIGISHARNFSSQMAFTSGMQLARGQAIICMDGDLQDPPELIAAFYRQWQAGYEVVYGIRTTRAGSWWLRLGYRLFYRVFRHLAYVPVPVDAGDFSLIDRKVVKVLLTFPERDRFLRGLRAWVGFRQIGVPYDRPERIFGSSTNNLLANFRWAIKGVFSFSYAPLQAMTLLSLAVFGLSIVGVVAQIIARFVLPEPPPGITTVLVVVLFMSGVQLLGLSILGEYVGKIFEEVKQRPLFVVKEVIKQSQA